MGEEFRKAIEDAMKEGANLEDPDATKHATKKKTTRKKQARKKRLSKELRESLK